MQYGQPVAKFKHHKGPITSVEWCPHETTTMMASGEDDQTTIWDLAVEAEPGEETIEVPPQLLFVHMGQKEIKEVLIDLWPINSIVCPVYFTPSKCYAQKSKAKKTIV